MHCRNGYKAIHIIRRSNRNGTFLEISEFHSSSCQEVVCITKGRNSQGWHAFAKLCKSFRDASQQSNKNGVANLRRRVAVGGSTTHERGEGSKPQITHNALSANNIISVSLENVTNSTNKEGLRNSSHSNFDVNARLNLTLELICELGGKWEVSRANVIQPRVPPKPRPPHTEAGPSTQDSRPKSSQQMWRPKSTQMDPAKTNSNGPSPDPMQPSSPKLIKSTAQTHHFVGNCECGTCCHA